MDLFDGGRSNASYRGIKAKGIDFSAFGTTEVDAVHAPKAKSLESDTALLWRSFASGVVSGLIDPNGIAHVAMEKFDPDLLAEVMNREVGDHDGLLNESYEGAITAFLKETDREKIRARAYQETLGRLGNMVDKLKPQMRRRFLNSMFKSCAQHPETAEDVLQKISQTALLDALEHMDAGSIEIPQALMDILAKLSSHRGDDVSHSRVVGVADRSSLETVERLTTLFSEDHSDFFVPEDYRDALAALATAKKDHSLEKSRLDEVLSGLESHRIEKEFNAVLLDLLGRSVDQSSADAIARNLNEMTGYFLETGDFESLDTIFTHLKSHVSRLSGEVSSKVREALERFASREFSDAVLDGLDTWGKSAHGAIQTLIKHVGASFADPLLDLLALEASMSRRHLLMVCLVKVGTQALPHIETRLNDERWFFVRNLVVVLRELNDPSVVPLLERIDGHEHPKVQYELMNAYLRYDDARASRFLVKELSGRDPASLIGATRLAEKSRDPQVVCQLAKLLNTRILAEHEHEVKNGAIRALLVNANEDVLPELEKFLLAKRLLGESRNLSLKIRAVEILEKIGTVDAGLLAGAVAQSATGEFARVAEEILVKIHGKLV